MTTTEEEATKAEAIHPEEEEKKKEEEEEEEDKKDIEEEEKKDEAASSPTPKFPFPPAFYDPTTKKLMMDPVVAPDGESYEKSTLVNSENYYPNRALQSYIEEELEQFADAGSLRGTLMTWQKSLRSGWQQLLEKSALPSGEYRPLPDAFYCPISFDLIHEPVIDPDGHTYEKAAILHWLQTNTESPVTRNQLEASQLRDNKALLSVLEFLTEEDDDDEEEAVHPSIRRWKTEHSTRVASHTHDIVPQTTTTTPTNNNQPPRNYATTQAELVALQRQRQQTDRVLLGVLIAVFVVMLFFPTYFVVALVFAVVVSLLTMSCRHQQDLRRAEILAQARAPSTTTGAR